MMKKTGLMILVSVIFSFIISFSDISAVYAADTGTMTASTTAASEVTIKNVTSTSYDRVSISWEKVSGYNRYVIYYRVKGTKKWKKIAAVSGSRSSYTHVSSTKLPITVGKTYQYTVRGYNTRKKKWSAYNRTGKSIKTTPNPVTLSNISSEQNGSSVTVSWKKASGCNYYKIYRKVYGGKYTCIGTVASDKCSYTDKNPIKGKVNIYTVRGYYSKTKALSKNYDKTGLSVTTKSTKKFYGIYDSGVNSIVSVAEKKKAPLQVVGWFEQLDGSVQGDYKLEQSLDEGKYIPFISLQIKGMKLEKFLDGYYDKQLKTFFKRVSSGNRKDKVVYVRFAHEMVLEDRRWYTWQTKDYNLYIKVWRYVWNLSQKTGATNIKWVWSPNRANATSKKFYPGDKYVDYVGVTSSLFGSYVGQYNSFEAFYKKVCGKKVLESFNKPIILGECGYAAKNTQEKKDYLLDMIDYVKNDNKIAGVIMLDASTSKRQFQFSNSSKILNQVLLRFRY